MPDKEKDASAKPQHSEEQQKDPTSTKAAAPPVKQEPPPQRPPGSEPKPTTRSADPQHDLTPAQKEARAAGSRAGGPFTPSLKYPVSVNDISMVVTDSAGIAIGDKVQIDNEILRVAQAWLATPYYGTNTIPVLRGQSGTVTAAHAAGIPVVIGDALTDFAIRAAPGLVTDYPGATPWSPSMSMGPTDTQVPVPAAIGFSTVTLPVSSALTLALPGPDLNGAMLTLLGNAAGSASVQIASTPPPFTPGGAAGSSVSVGPGEAKLFLANGGNWIAFPTA